MSPLSIVQGLTRESRLWWAAVCLYSLLMVMLSVQVAPLAGMPLADRPHADKALHLIEYSLLSFLLYKALTNTFGRWSAVKITIVVFVLATGYSLGIECYQEYVPYRSACVYDAIANHAGILLGLSISLL